MRIVGDYALRDLTPPGSNIGGRIVKNMRICGSGLYRYHRTEAATFGLDLSGLPGDQEYFHIYRPPEVLKANKDLFARVPIITGSHVIVDQNNVKDLMVGMVGDSVSSEVDSKDGELYLYTTGTIVAGDGIEMYERFGQLSVGYVPRAKWQKGVHKGEPYEAILEGFSDVNHLLLCPRARGGPQCMVMDSADALARPNIDIGGNKVKFFEKIFGVKKPEVLAGDARVPVLLQSIAAGADPATQVKAIQAITAPMKIAGDAKATWDEYMTELAGCKDASAEDKAKAIDIVREFYGKLAGDAHETPEGKKDDHASGSHEQAPGDCGPDCTCEKCKAKKAAGDVKPEEKKEAAGDALDARFGKIEDSISKLTAAVGTLVAAATPEPAAGDQAPGVSTVNMAGDTTPGKKESVADFMANLRG